MKRIFTLCICLLSAAYGYAQTNTVLLMDRLGSIISTHSTIQGAYNAIPATLTQPYTIELQSAYKGTFETYPVRFVEKSGASNVNTIKIAGSGMADMRIDTADMFQFDGADWVSFDGKFYIRRIGLPNYNVFHFKNGACHNKIKGVLLSGGAGVPVNTIALGHSVYFGPTLQAGGNSNNTIESCQFNGAHSAIASTGNANNRNTNISIKDNNFGGYAQCIRLSATDTVLVSGNTIGTFALKKQTRALIDINEVGGRITIDKNNILVRGDSGAITGLYLKPAQYHEALISNNIIQTFSATHTELRSLDTFADAINNITGVWLDGTGAVGKNEIYHNTIVIWGKCTVIANDVQSYCMRISGTHNAAIDIKNNIFLNYRKEGKNAKHKVFDFNSISSVLKLDYNRYCAYGGMANGLGGNSWNSWAYYKSVLATLNGSETNSDSADVWFAGGYGKGGALHARMYLTPGMFGTPLPSVPTDILGTARTLYYKGVNEYTLNCPATLSSGKINVGTDSCGGHFSALIFNGKIPAVNGVTYQWQSRPGGSSLPFSDISGEDMADFSRKNTTAIDCRVQVGCIGSANVAYSDTATLFIKPLPSVDSMKIVKRQGWEYMFTAMGAQLTTDYSWNFEEGASLRRTNDTIIYSFKTPGPHNIRLVVTNDYCGYDTAYATLDVGLGIDDITTANAIKVYPNPATDRLMADVAENTAYTVTDISGRIVLNGKINASGIDISGLSKGLYLLGFSTPGQSKVYARFIKE